MQKVINKIQQKTQPKLGLKLFFLRAQTDDFVKGIVQF